MKKGIIVNYLCLNPSCSYSETILKKGEVLNITGNGAKFKLLNKCPKCFSELEIINFVSGVVEITEDKINTEDKKEN